MEDQKVTKKSRRQDSGSEFEEFDEDNSESSVINPPFSSFISIFYMKMTRF